MLDLRPLIYRCARHITFRLSLENNIYPEPLYYWDERGVVSKKKKFS
jgi:hypothetical protein